MPDNSNLEIQIKLKELEMNIERIIDHKTLFKKTLDEMAYSLKSFELAIKDMSHSIGNLKDMPNRIDKLEDENIKSDTYKGVIKMVTGIVIGLLVAHFINNLVLANKEEKDYQIENTK